MEAPPTFKMPGRSHHQPLQTLSPERVNAARPLSAASFSSKTSKTSGYSDHAFAPREQPMSTQSSPTRKANLFADYHPVTTQPQGSIILGGGLAQSPSMPEFRTRGNSRTNSDVQGLVKRFEHLDVKDRDAEYSERRKKHEAELRRAQIAREEAESDVKRLREEARRLRKEGEEGKDRERRLARRVEVILEESTSAKEQYMSQHAVYDKELRKCRKEAYKSSSAVIKLQEELKATRQSLRITQTGLDVEKQKVQHREQETFNAQYQLAAVQEELDKLRAHLKIVEDEKEAMKQNLKDEEVARIAAEGMIALPISQEDEDLLNSPGKHSPKKRSGSPWSDDKENLDVQPPKFGETKRLQEELLHEQIRRGHAEEMVDFLTMECKFRCCSCQSRSKDSQEHDLVISGGLASRLEQVMEGMRLVLTSPSDLSTREDMQRNAREIQVEPLEKEQMEEVEQQLGPQQQSAARSEADAQVEREAVVNDDLSMTMVTEPVPEQQVPEMPQQMEEEPMAPRPTPALPDLETSQALAENTATVPLQPPSPQTPSQPHQAPTPYRTVRTITTTTTIPMHFTPVVKHQLPLPHEGEDNIEPAASTGDKLHRVKSGPPADFDREAALAAIEYRRGRAKSIAAGHATPRKQMLEGVNLKERRDISAPALGQQGKSRGLLGKNAASASVGRAAGRSGRLV